MFCSKPFCLRVFIDVNLELRNILTLFFQRLVFLWRRFLLRPLSCECSRLRAVSTLPQPPILPGYHYKECFSQQNRPAATALPLATLLQKNSSCKTRCRFATPGLSPALMPCLQLKRCSSLRICLHSPCGVSRTCLFKARVPTRQQ